MDNLTKEQRRKNMQHIHSKDTKIEVILRKALWQKGYRYRKNCKDVCMESTGKYWIPVFNVLEKNNIFVTLSHPKYIEPPNATVRM